MTVWLIIFAKLVLLFTCVQSDQVIKPGAFNSHGSPPKLLGRSLDAPKWQPAPKALDHSLDHSPFSESALFKTAFTSVSSPKSPKSPKSSAKSSNRPLRIKRENQLLINNELANGLSSHDSNTFQPNGESSTFLFRSVVSGVLLLWNSLRVNRPVRQRSLIIYRKLEIYILIERCELMLKTCTES